MNATVDKFYKGVQRGFGVNSNAESDVDGRILAEPKGVSGLRVDLYNNPP